MVRGHAVNNPTDLSASAEAITVEIGLDMSYLTDESERNFLGLDLAIGYLLLHWFIEGLVKGAGEATGEALAKDAKHGVAGAVNRLRERVTKLFSRKGRTPAADAAAVTDLAAQAENSIREASTKLSTTTSEKVAEVAEAYERALVDYLSANGMPAGDALRVAQKVRKEAGIQLGLTP
jgi:hypothetical protein